MPELNRDKIMKCLRHCNGGDCETCKVLGTACDASWTFHKDALTLIKQLTEENERLKEKADRHLDNLKAVLDERAEQEVAMEIFEEIEGSLSLYSYTSDGNTHSDDMVLDVLEWVDRKIADLKKKYIGE